MKIPKRRLPVLRASPSVPSRPETAPEPVADPVSAPAIVARAFSVSGIALRARVLSRMLASVGPLALAVVAGGAFVKYVGRARWGDIPVSIEDAANATRAQVFELARYLQQSNPEVVDQVLSALAGDGAVVAALGASLAAIAYRRLGGA